MMRPPPLFSLFFFNDTATTEIYTLSLHDALPISTVTLHNLAYGALAKGTRVALRRAPSLKGVGLLAQIPDSEILKRADAEEDRKSTRLNSSHQIISYAVFCLKKKKKRTRTH